MFGSNQLHTNDHSCTLSIICTEDIRSIIVGLEGQYAPEGSNDDVNRYTNCTPALK